MSDHLADYAYFRGRVALSALLKSLGVGRGHTVAIQAFTCLAVPEGVMATGAQPLYIDIEPDGFNMRPDSLRSRLTAATRAIVVQHTFGLPADMAGLLSVAQDAGIPVIEDCCHTLASTYADRVVGSFGVGAFYSFEWGKPVVVGIGGAARVNDAAVAGRVEADYAAYQAPPRARLVRLRAQYVAHRLLYRPSLFWPVRSLYHALGALGAAEANYNPVSTDRVADDFRWRMARPLQSLLRRKLSRLDAISAHSRAVTDAYKNGIVSTAIRLPGEPSNCATVFCRYPLRSLRKAELLHRARVANVELAEWYATPVHPLGPSELEAVHYRPGACPEAERRCGEVVTLPTHPAVHRRDVRRAIEFLNARAAG